VSLCSRDCLTTEMRCMKNDSVFFPSVLIILVLLFLIFTVHVPAQTIEPDEQLKLQMIAYVRQVEDTVALSRPRVVYQSALLAKSEEPKYFVNEIEVSENAAAPKTFALERQAFEILNQRRIENGLKPLEWNEDLARVARLHSENMAQFHFFSHAGPNGEMVNDRADALGISNWRSIGENIVYNRGFKKPVESACVQWMESPTHRANLLDKKWKETGIGAAVAPDGTYYFTQVFILN
jgi:uncharacterized protein YkwD